MNEPKNFMNTATLSPFSCVKISTRIVISLGISWHSIKSTTGTEAASRQHASEAVGYVPCYSTSLFHVGMGCWFEVYRCHPRKQLIRNPYYGLLTIRCCGFDEKFAYRPIILPELKFWIKVDKQCKIFERHINTRSGHIIMHQDIPPSKSEYAEMPSRPMLGARRNLFTHLNANCL